MSWPEIVWRVVFGLLAVLMCLGAWNLYDEAESWWDWALVGPVLVVFAALVGVYGYWAVYRTW